MLTVSVADLASGAGDLALDGDAQPGGPLVVDLDASHRQGDAERAAARLDGRHCVVLGRLRDAPTGPTEVLAQALDLVLVDGRRLDDPALPRWAVGSPSLDDELTVLVGSAEASPIAALSLAQVLRLTAGLPVQHGLVLESMAYSMLLASPEFGRWRSATPRRPPPEVSNPVRLARDDDRLTVTMANAQRRNAFGRAMRDGLVAAFELAAIDRSIAQVHLRGEGPAFCSGGDLDEFGTIDDVSSAHLIRLQQGAGVALHRIANRATAHLHGACIGAGIEVAAFAGRVLAAPGTCVQLPELAMGLIPGAGGTVSLTARIGRWRTFYLALLGTDVPVADLAGWGLVDGHE